MYMRLTLLLQYLNAFAVINVFVLCIYRMIQIVNAIRCYVIYNYSVEIVIDPSLLETRESNTTAKKVMTVMPGICLSVCLLTNC